MNPTKRTTGRTPTAEATPRVALYLRISTDEEHQPFSLEAQEHRLSAFVPTQPGWAHVRTYVDRTSGAHAERPGLSDALRDARLGLYDVLLVYRVDRFARSLKVLVHLLEELDQAGVAFRSATEPIDTSTATGRMLVQLLGVFAEFERATIIDRVVAGMERKAARGGWPGGSRPYGLRLDVDGRLSCEPTEFPIVEWIFTRYAVDRCGAASIAGELNSDGLRTRAGKPWSAKVVLDVLRNRAYLGEVSFRGTWHQSSAEPLLDPVLFEKVQTILARRGEGYDRRFADTHPHYLLTGLITCGRCGRRYVGTAATGKRHRTATTRAGPASGTAPKPARESASGPTRWRRPCSPPWAICTPIPTSSAEPSPFGADRPPWAHDSAVTSSRPRMRSWPRARRPSIGTCTPSRTAR